MPYHAAWAAWGGGSVRISQGSRCGVAPWASRVHCKRQAEETKHATAPLALPDDCGQGPEARAALRAILALVVDAQEGMPLLAHNGLVQPARVQPPITNQLAGTTPSRRASNASQCGRHFPFLVAGTTTQATGMAQPL